MPRRRGTTPRQAVEDTAGADGAKGATILDNQSQQASKAAVGSHRAVTPQRKRATEQPSAHARSAKATIDSA